MKLRMAARNSVRVRLTLWNGLVLALILAGGGIALCSRIQVDLAASVDAELRRSARQFAANAPRFLPMDEKPPPRGPGREPDPGRRDPVTTEAQDTDFRRPRQFTVDGRPMDRGGEDRPWDLDALARSAAGQELFTTVQVAGQPVRVFSMPVRSPEGEVVPVIQMAYSLGDLHRLTGGLYRTLLTLIPLALLVAGLTGILMTDRTLRPMRKVTDAAAKIGADDLSQRLEVIGQDEFAALAGTFNGMIARLQQAFQRLETAYARLERAFEQQKRFTADASHELRTPLTRIKGSTSLALAGSRLEEGYRQALQVVDQAANVMDGLIRDLLFLARADAEQLRLELRPVPVDTLFDRAIAEVDGDKSIPINLDLPREPLAVMGSLDPLVRVLTNLISNAVRHTPAEGRITLAARRQENGVVLTVSDTGEGIAPEHLPQVCERFYRVDGARTRSQGGTGLGLAICQSIVHAHGGTLEIESVVGQGTTVWVTLPCADLPATAEPVAEGSSGPHLLRSS